jgi:WD40 repeat protein
MRCVSSDKRRASIKRASQQAPIERAWSGHHDGTNVRKLQLLMSHTTSSTSFTLLILLLCATWRSSSGMIIPSVVRSLHAFAGVGVTSILPVPKEVLDNDDEEEDIRLSFYVGTKRGKMKKVTMKNPKKVRHDDDVRIQCIQDNEKNGSKGSKTPYPIFSMLSLCINQSHHHVVSGSGDRYITVWEEQDNRQQQHQEDDGIGVSSSSWRIKAKLGPHTGWVKDLASSHSPQDRNVQDKEEQERFLFSIGCNCIEVWKTAIHGEQYDHVHKLMIESSVEMGTTLSSDILCLATSPAPDCYNTNQQKKSEQQEEKQHSYYLFAGGVDGRIHRWTICNNSVSDAQVVYAPGHDGRVNALLVCHTLRVVVSIGNDGFVKCWMLDESTEPSFMERRVWSVNVNDERNDVVAQQSDTITKLTCSCILLETQDIAIIGIGTACGKVLLVELKISNDSSSRSSDDDDMSMTLLDERIVVQSSSTITKGIGGGCVIHSIASQNNHIIIGHSEGISIWEPMLLGSNPSCT